jgi:hypothetical protein
VDILSGKKIQIKGVLKGKLKGIFKKKEKVSASQGDKGGEVK